MQDIDSNYDGELEEDEDSTRIKSSVEPMISLKVTCPPCGATFKDIMVNTRVENLRQNMPTSFPVEKNAKEGSKDCGVNVKAGRLKKEVNE